MKNLLITQTSLRGFGRPQAIAKVLVLKGRVVESGRLGLWSRGSMSHRVDSDPCGQSRSPPHLSQWSRLELGAWGCISYQMENGLQTKLGIASGLLSLPCLHKTSWP